MAPLQREYFRPTAYLRRKQTLPFEGYQFLRKKRLVGSTKSVRASSRMLRCGGVGEVVDEKPLI